MSNGRYFELDKESKSLDSKMVVFNYLRYKNTKTYEKGERIQPEYPIYVVFMKDGVRFYLHTSEHSDNNTISHYSGCILFMPLSLDNDFHCEMTAILNGALDTNITINSNIRENHDVNGFDKAIFKKKNSISKENKTSEKGISKGQLILDFMFDMEHSSVFKNSTMYDKVYSRFHEHHLYNAINTKAEYKFWQKECREKDTDIFSIEMFSRIERKWVEIISNGKSEYLFHESSWFNDNVDEMNEIYEAKYSCLDLCGKNKKVSKCEEKDRIEKINKTTVITSKISRDWYMSKYKPGGVLRIMYGKSYKFLSWLLGIAIFLMAVSFSVYPLFLERIDVPKAFKTIIIVLILIIVLTILLRLLVKRPWMDNLLVMIMPRLFAGICAAWMTIGLSSIVKYHYEDYYLATLLCTSIITVFFIFVSIRKQLPFEKSIPEILKLFIISIIMMSISIIYSVISGSLLFHIYEAGAEVEFSPLLCMCDAKTLLTFSSLSMFVGVFINMLFHNKSISSYE